MKNLKKISIILIATLLTVMFMTTMVKADTTDNTLENTIGNTLGDTLQVTSTVTNTKIDKINITVKAPEVGSKIVNENTKPNITLEDNANYNLTWTMYIDGFPSTCPTYDAGKVF